MGAKCPKCGSEVIIDFSNEEGDSIWCDDCDATLQIVKINPPKVKLDGRKKEEEGFESFDEDDEDDEIRWEEN
ncbi:MAG: hypothetical protein ABH862_05455 [Candidatus Omnitrophota bacterium]